MTDWEQVPAARELPSSYPRHAPDRAQLRTVLAGLIAGPDWAGLSWSELVEALAGLGRTDIGLARLTEGHVDAVRIAAQAGASLEPDALYGVWASRSGASGVRARADGDRLVLTGTLKFASGAGVIDRGLTPVWLSDDTHLLVDLDARELPVDRSAWQTGAMTVSHTHTISLDEVVVPRSTVVGRPNFYLDRPGFFPGGVGVAAVWAGGISRVLDALLAWAGDRSSPAGDLRLGRIAIQRTLALAAVRQGGHHLDARPAGPQPPTHAELQHLSTSIRAGVGQAVQAALNDARVLAGPAGLAFDAALTHAIDDLGLYVLQQNTDGDAGYLGAAVRRR